VQVFILDSLSNYTPKDDREAQSICERITPRLAHANAAVVLSAVKVRQPQLPPFTATVPSELEVWS
jgi:vesicle coat complex subunit